MNVRASSTIPGSFDRGEDRRQGCGDAEPARQVSAAATSYVSALTVDAWSAPPEDPGLLAAVATRWPSLSPRSAGRLPERGGRARKIADPRRSGSLGADRPARLHCAPVAVRWIADYRPPRDGT